MSEVSEENKYRFKKIVKDAALNFDETAKENLVRKSGNSLTPNKIVKNDILKAEYNLDQILLEKKEKEVFELLRDYQIEKKFTQFWIKQMKGTARIVEESLLSGMVRCLFVHQHMSFEELRANFFNDPVGSKTHRSRAGEQGLEYEKIKDCFFSINFKNMKFHKTIAEDESLIHQIDLESVLEASYSCVDLAIR